MQRNQKGFRRADTARSLYWTVDCTYCLNPAHLLPLLIDDMLHILLIVLSLTLPLLGHAGNQSAPSPLVLPPVANTHQPSCSEIRTPYQLSSIMQSLSLKGRTALATQPGIIYLPVEKPEEQGKGQPPTGLGSGRHTGKNQGQDSNRQSQQSQPPAGQQSSGNERGEQQNQPPSDPFVSQSTEEQQTEDYFALVVNGAEFHLKKEQIPPLMRGQENPARITVHNPANPAEKIPLNEIEAVAGIPEPTRLAKFGNTPLDYLLTYGTEATKNSLQHYYPVSLISVHEGHLVADVDHRSYPMDEKTCQICNELLLARHSLSHCTHFSQHVFHTGCLAFWLQAMVTLDGTMPESASQRQKGCPVCREEQPPALRNLFSKEGLVSELHRAAKAGDSVIIKALLEAQVDAEAMDEQGNTALHLAAQAGHSDVVLLLTDFGVNFEAENSAGQQPVAAAAEYPDIIDILKQANQNPNIFFTVTTGREEALRQWLAEGNNLETTRPLDGASLLHLAVQNNHVDMARQLLEMAQLENIDLVNKMDNSKATPLMVATTLGSTENVELLLSSSIANVDLKNVEGFTALMLATQNPENIIFDLLLRNNANVNLVSNSGLTALFLAFISGHSDMITRLIHLNANPGKNKQLLTRYACQEGDLELLNYLLEINGDINTPINDKSDTPLVLACKYGHQHLVEFLLKKGAAIQLATENASAPLLGACMNGDIHIVKLLLNEGANPNLPGIENTLPLQSALEGGHMDIFSLLLKKGADINKRGFRHNTLLVPACGRGDISLVRFLLTNGANPNSPGMDDMTPLWIACQYNQSDIAQLLIERGAKVNHIVPGKGSALFVACALQHAELVDLLLDNGAQGIDTPGPGNMTPLEAAAAFGSAQIVDKLLNHECLFDKDLAAKRLVVACTNGYRLLVDKLLNRGADPNLPGTENTIPLQGALDGSHMDIFSLLIDKGADINKRGFRNNTVLVPACGKGDISLVRFLLDHGANPNSSGMDDMTPLWIASQYNQLDVARLLLSRGARIDLDVPLKGSPLWVASARCELEMVNLLLEHNAPVDQPGPRGMTPLDVAVITGLGINPNHAENVIRILIKNEATLTEHGLQYAHTIQDHKLRQALLSRYQTSAVEASEKGEMVSPPAKMTVIQRQEPPSISMVPTSSESVPATSEDYPLLAAPYKKHPNNLPTHHSSCFRDFLRSCCGGNPED